jgi:hypothetical protein
MANINWDVPFSFTVEVPLPDPLPPTELTLFFPTYGLNGGANFTNGDFNVNPLDFSEPVGVDLIDLTFFDHDVATALAGTDAGAQAQADYDLLHELVGFNRHDLADPEASLYAGATELAMIASLFLNPEGVDLTKGELTQATRDAVRNIEYGITHLDSDELQDVQDWIGDVNTALGGLNLQLDDILSLGGVDVPRLHHQTLDLLAA